MCRPSRGAAMRRIATGSRTMAWTRRRSAPRFRPYMVRFGVTPGGCTADRRERSAGTPFRVPARRLSIAALGLVMPARRSSRRLNRGTVTTRYSAPERLVGFGLGVRRAHADIAQVARLSSRRAAGGCGRVPAPVAVAQKAARRRGRRGPVGVPGQPGSLGQAACGGETDVGQFARGQVRQRLAGAGRCAAPCAGPSAMAPPRERPVGCRAETKRVTSDRTLSVHPEQM